MSERRMAIKLRAVARPEERFTRCARRAPARAPRCRERRWTPTSTLASARTVDAGTSVSASERYIAADAPAIRAKRPCKRFVDLDIHRLTHD